MSCLSHSHPLAHHSPTPCGVILPVWEPCWNRNAAWIGKMKPCGRRGMLTSSERRWTKSEECIREPSPAHRHTDKAGCCHPHLQQDAIRDAIHALPQPPLPCGKSGSEIFLSLLESVDAAHSNCSCSWSHSFAQQLWLPTYFLSRVAVEVYPIISKASR